MDVSSDYSVVVVNRNFPPYGGITGESAHVLAQKICAADDRVEISAVTVRSSYTKRNEFVESTVTLHTIPSLYDGKNKLFRLFSTFVESGLLIRKAKGLSADLIIVMTDPPFLSLWAPLLLGNKVRWGRWTMDLFPEAFVSSGFVKRRNFFYRVLESIVYKTPPRFIIALGELQAEYLRRKYKKPLPTAILPCGLYVDEDEKSIPDWYPSGENKIVLGYCGNLGEAHSVEFLLAVIEALDANKFHLILSIYGVKAQKLLSNISQDTLGVTIVASVEKSELKYIDVHLASLSGNWNHVCVPSKVVSAVCASSSFIFYGSKECDTWFYLQKAGWIVTEENDNTQLYSKVVKLLDTIDKKAVEERKYNTHGIVRDLVMLEKDAYGVVEGFIASGMESSVLV